MLIYCNQPGRLSHLGDRRRGVAELVQHGTLRQLGLGAWAAPSVILHGQPADEDGRVLRWREAVLLDLGLVSVVSRVSCEWNG